MKILLIDTQQHALDAIKPAFNASKDDITHVTNLAILQELLQQTKFDVVVTPSLLGKINGDELLRTLTSSFPQMIRVQVINHEHYTTKHAHFNFAQPLNLAAIKTKLSQSQKHSQAITKDLIVKTIANVKTLPSPPKVYMQLTHALKDSNTDSQKIADIILQDPGLTAKYYTLLIVP